MQNSAFHFHPALRRLVVQALHFCALGLILCVYSTSNWPAQAQSVLGGDLPQTESIQDTTLDDPRPEGGFQGLANLLEKAKPGIDTRLDPTPAQVTYRIESLITAGRLDEALLLVRKRQAELQHHGLQGSGTDVQLQFQHARTLTALGKNSEAKAIYTKLTTLHPELPEPWNNLAVLWVAQGNFEGAAQALQRALLASPRDNIARGNLADVQLMMAQCNYRKAGRTTRLFSTINLNALSSVP